MAPICFLCHGRECGSHSDAKGGRWTGPIIVELVLLNDVTVPRERCFEADVLCDVKAKRGTLTS